MNNDEKTRFGKAFKEVVKSNRLTLAEISDVVGVSPQYLSQITTGNTLPSSEYYNAIMEFLRPRVADDQYHLLLELYVEARTGINKKLISISAPQSDDTPQMDELEKMFLVKFKKLAAADKYEIMRQIELFSNRNKKN